MAQSTLENSLAISYKAKYSLIIWFHNCASKYLTKSFENLYLHQNLYMNMYNNLIYNFPKLEASKIYLNIWMDKLCYIYKMEYYLPIEVTELSSNEHNTDAPYIPIANWKKSDKKKKTYILCGSNSMNFWKGKHLKETLKAGVDAKDSGEEGALARWNTREYCFKWWNYFL